jgi:hypothetical protein
VLIIAHTVQLEGTLAVRGGAAGYPGPAYVTTSAGSPGQITLLVDALYAPAGALPLVGPARMGRTLPVDPVPGYGVPDTLYWAASGHTLSGAFLAFWQAHGGLDVLGAPASEPFVEGGRQLQYTDQALLQLRDGAVSLVALGRLLAHLTPTQAAF